MGESFLRRSRRMFNAVAEEATRYQSINLKCVSRRSKDYANVNWTSIEYYSFL